MSSIFRRLIITVTAAMLCACASTPDPAEVCSSEWIVPRADKATAKIEKRASSSIRALTKASKSWATGKSPNFLQKLALFNSLEKLKKELTRGQGIKDLKTIAKTCNDPKIIGDSMRSLLDRQGVSETTLNWIENNPIYNSLISTISEPEPVTPNG